MDLVSPAGTLKLSRKVHQPVELSSLYDTGWVLTAATTDSATLTSISGSLRLKAMLVAVCVPALAGMAEMEFGVVYYSCIPVGISSRYFQSFGRNASVRSSSFPVAAEV